MILNTGAADACYPRHSKPPRLDVPSDIHSPTSSCQGSLQHPRDALDRPNSSYSHVTNDTVSRTSYGNQVMSHPLQMQRTSSQVSTHRDGATVPEVASSYSAGSYPHYAATTVSPSPASLAGSALHLPATTRRLNPSLSGIGSGAWERADYLPRTSLATSAASVTHIHNAYRPTAHTPTRGAGGNVTPKSVGIYYANNSDGSRGYGSTATATLSMQQSVEAASGTALSQGPSSVTPSTHPAMSAAKSGLRDRASSAVYNTANTHGTRSDGWGLHLPAPVSLSPFMLDSLSQRRTKRRFRVSAPTAASNHVSARDSLEDVAAVARSPATSSTGGAALSKAVQWARLCLPKSPSAAHSRTPAASLELNNGEYTTTSTTPARSPRWSPDASLLMGRGEETGIVRSPRTMPSKSLLSTVAEPYPLSGEADAPADDSDQVAPVWWTVDIVIAPLPSSSDSAYGEASAIETAALLRLPADMRALRSTQCRAPVLPADVSPAEAWELTQSFLRSIALTSVSTHSPPCAPQGYFYFDTDFNQYVQLTADTLSLASTLIRIVMVTTAVGFAEVKEVCPWSEDASDATADHAHENLILSQGPSTCSHRLSTRTSQSLGHDDTTAQHLGNDRTKPGVTVAPPRSPGGCSASAPRHSSHPSALDETTGSRHHFNPVGETLSYRPHSRSGFEAEARPLETWTNFDPTDVVLRHQGCFSQREDVEAEKLQHLTCPRAMGAHADEKNDFPVNWANVGDTARSAVSQYAPSTSCRGRAGCHHHARYNSSARMETQDITVDQGDMDSVKRTGDNEIAQHMEAEVVTQKAALRAARAAGRRHRSNRGSSSNTDSTNRVELFHSAPPPLKPSANQLPSRSSTHDLPTQMGTSCRAPPRPPSAVHTQGYSRGVVAEEVRTPPSPPPPASALPQQQRFLDDPVLQRRVETPLGQTTSSLPCAAWSPESGGGGPYPIYAPSPPPMVPVSQSPSLAHGAYEPALHPYFDPPFTATTTTSVLRDRASLSLSSASFTEAFVKRIHGAQHDVLTALLQRSAQARQRAHCTGAHSRQPSPASSSGVAASATPAGVAMCTRSEVSHATSGADVNSAPAATMAAVGSTVPPLGASFCSSVSATPPSSMPENAAPRDVTDALSAFFKTRGSKGSDCGIPGYWTDEEATTTSGADEPFWGPAADGSDAVPAAGAQRKTYSARRPPANIRTGLSTAAGHAEAEECDVPHASASVATHDASNGRSCRHSQEHFPSADARSAQVEDRNKMSFVNTEALVKSDYTCKEASNAPGPGMHSQVPPERITPMPHVGSPRGVPRVQSDGAVAVRPQKQSGGSSGVNNTAETNGAAVDDSISGVGHHGMEARATVDFLVTDAVTEARDEREGGDEAKLLNAVEPETDVVLDGCGGGLCVVAGGGRGEAASSQQPCHYARLKDVTENEARTAFRDTATAATQQTETTDVSASPLSLHRGNKNTLANAATMEMALNASAGVGADTLAPGAGLGGGGPTLHSMAAAAELISNPVTSEAPPQVLRDLAAAAAVEDRTLHRQRERFATGGKGTGDGAVHVNATAEVESGRGRDEKFRSAAPEPATSATTRQTPCNSSPLMDTPTLIRKGSRREEDVSVAATLGSGGRAGVLSDVTDPGRRLLPTPRRGMPAANGDAGADDADVISYTYHEEVSPAAITAAAEGEADTTDKGGVCIDTSAAEVISTCLSVASSLPVALPEAPSPPIDAGTGGDGDSLWKITVGAERYIDTAEKKPHAKPPSSAVAEMGDPVPPLLDVSDVGGDNSAAVLDAPLITVISQCGAPDAPPLPTSQPHVPLWPPHQPRNDVAMRRTMVLLGFPGSAWEFIMTHYYEHMHEAFTSDSAVAANVPVSAIQDVRYSKGGLMVDLYVLHPVSLSEASIRELMSSYSYPTLWALYEAKKRERKQLLRSRGTSVVSETSGRSQPHPSTLALSPQEEVGWTGS